MMWCENSIVYYKTPMPDVENDVVDVTSTLLSCDAKWRHWLFRSGIPNAKFPQIIALLNRSTYYKSAKALSPNFMDTLNPWISWL